MRKQNKTLNIDNKDWKDIKELITVSNGQIIKLLLYYAFKKWSMDISEDEI